MFDPIGNYSMLRTERTAGYWCIGALQIPVSTRPRWITRLLCRALLEWTWADAP